MIQFSSVQLLLLGAVAVLDTALLLALIDRRNRHRVIVPVSIVVVGTWLFHCGAFVNALLPEATWPWLMTARLILKTAMAVGLLLIPSAMLHCVVRLHRTGLSVLKQIDFRHSIFYVPLLSLIYAVPRLAADPVSPLTVTLEPMLWPYIGWLTLVNLTAGFGFLALKKRFEQRWLRTFGLGMALSLLAIAALHAFAFLIAVPLWPQTIDYWLLAATVSPAAVIVLFAYYVMRFNFMQLMIERTAVYAAIVLGLLLVHHLFLSEIWTTLNEKYHVDFVILEVIALVALVVAVGPLRRRVSEALRYLMGERVGKIREETKRLATEMSRLAGHSPQDVLTWFCQSVSQVFGLSYISVWLLDDRSKVITQSGNTDVISLETVVLLHARMEQADDADSPHQVGQAGQVTAAPQSPPAPAAITSSDAPDAETANTMHSANADLAIRLDHPGGSGLVLLGRRSAGRALSQEQSNALIMLVEQLGITVSNSMLQAQRIAAERRALQNERLSTLGLITSSIAHEVKNPLSSIKTIATVLAEDQGPDGPNAKDLNLIVEQIDRLSRTVTQLLHFARPKPGAGGASNPTSIVETLEGILHILRHVAAKQSVNIQTDFCENTAKVRGDPDSLMEIFLNLLSNSIDAAGAGGDVWVTCKNVDSQVVIQVRDSGPGVDPKIQDRLFEPFVTTKDEGTGLGLYIVSRRVRELEGQIDCQTVKGQGTIFTVSLPVQSIEPDQPLEARRAPQLEQSGQADEPDAPDQEEQSGQAGQDS